MDSILKVTETETPENKYTIFYYKIPVSFVSPYVHVHVRECNVLHNLFWTKLTVPIWFWHSSQKKIKYLNLTKFLFTNKCTFY